jgi:Rieske Fe-S protein
MKIMVSHRGQSFRYGLNAAGSLVALIAALVFTVGVQGAHAQQTANAPAVKVKPPPLPNGSANVKLKAGMSDEDWELAYKETGRPKFNRNSVKKLNGNVERD